MKIMSLPRLIHNRSGLAATEFALLLPVMLILFFGVVEGSDALSQSKKVTLAANTLADLASQETNLLTSDVDNLFDGVAQIAGADSSEMTIRLVSIVADPSTGDPIVHWSRDNSGKAPYAPGSTYARVSMTALLDPGASIIVGEVSYAYNSSLTHFVMSSTVNFDEAATRWPRSALRVQLCTSVGNCTS